VLRCSTQNPPESLFPFGTRRGRGFAGEEVFCLSDKTRPISEFEVGEGTTGSGGRVIGEVRDGDREVIGVQLGVDWPGKGGEEMSRHKRDVRRRAGKVTIRKTSGGVSIQDTKVTGFNSRGEGVPTGVTRIPRGEPAWVVSVEVSEEDGIIVRKVKKISEVRMITNRTRGHRRKIDIVKVKLRVPNFNMNSQEFNGLIEIGDSTNVNVGEGDKIVDEDYKAPATTSRAILTNEGEVRKHRLFRFGQELCLLQAGNFDRVFQWEKPRVQLKYFGGRWHWIGVGWS
jgi:hypothetical protein